MDFAISFIAEARSIPKPWQPAPPSHPRRSKKSMATPVARAEIKNSRHSRDPSASAGSIRVESQFSLSHYGDRDAIHGTEREGSRERAIKKTRTTTTTTTTYPGRRRRRRGGRRRGWLAEGVHGISIARQNNWVQSGRLPYVTSAPFKPMQERDCASCPLFHPRPSWSSSSWLGCAPAKRSSRPAKKRAEERDYWTECTRRRRANQRVQAEA